MDKTQTKTWKKRIALVLSGVLLAGTFFDVLALIEMRRSIRDYKNDYKQVVERAFKESPPPTSISPVIADMYRKTTDEIKMRIEHEHTLFMHQFVVIGGVLTWALGTAGLFSARRSISINRTLGTLIANGSFTLIFGVAAIALLMIGIHISYNSKIIVELGEWCRVTYEGSNAWGWESYLQRFSPFHSSIGFAVSMPLLWLPCILILAGYYIMLFSFSGHRKRNEAVVKSQRWVLVAVQFSISLLLFTQNLGFWEWSTKSGRDRAWMLGVWLFLAITVGRFGWKILGAGGEDKGTAKHESAK